MKFLTKLGINKNSLDADRKQAELYSFAEMFPVPVILLDAALTIKVSNSLFSELSGYSITELSDRSLVQIVNSLVKPDELQDLLQSENRYEKFMAQLIDRNDSELLVTVSAAVVPTDITIDASYILTIQPVEDTTTYTQQSISRIDRALTVLSQCNYTLLHASNEQSLLNGICRIITDIGEYKFAWVGFAQNDLEKSVKPVAFSGESVKYLDGIRITWADDQYGRGPVGSSIRTGEARITKIIEEEPDFSPWRNNARAFGFGSVVSLPLTIHGDTVGALAIYASESDAFDEEEFQLLHDLSQNLQYALSVQRVQQEQRQAEDALRESYNFLNTLVNGSPDPTFVKDTHGRYTMINPAASHVLGATPEEIIGKVNQEFFPPDLAKVLDGQDHEILRTGISKSFEDVVFINNEPRTLLTTKYVYKHINGDVGGIVGISRDITERIKVEEELNKSYALYQQAEQLGRFAHWEWDDVNQSMTSCSDQLASILGLSVEETLEACSSIDKHLELLHPDDRARYLKEETETDLLNLEYRIITKEGEIRYLHEISIPVTDEKGNTVRSFGTVQDITERKLAEEALQKNEQRYRSLIEPTQVIPWELDMNLWKATYIGPQVTDTLGYDLDSMYDEEFWIKFVHEDDKQKVKYFYQSQLNSKDSNELEYRIINSTGEIVWIRDLVTLVKDNNDRPLLQGIMINITENVEKEAQLIQAQKMEAVGRLTGGIAHDFNNLLTIIQGNLKFLDWHLSDHNDNTIKELLNDAASASRDGAELTARLLAFSRTQSLKPEKVHINELVDTSLRLLRRTIGEDISIKTVLTKNNPTVLIDTHQFSNALLNLMINARDSMSSGGIITLKTGHKKLNGNNLTEQLELDQGNYVTVTIIDNGSGMNEEVLQHACDPFFTTKSADQGSGLGLSMVYGFVKQSGGGIEITSEKDKGTTVTLYLPRIDKVTKKKTPAEKQNNENSLLTGSGTILVVEDEERVQRFAIRSLKSLGYNVLKADDASQAREQLSANLNIDLLFSDNVLPGNMNGRELAEWAQKNNPALKVVLTTGFTKQMDDVPYAYDGSYPILKKPYSQEELAKHVQAALSGAENIDSVSISN